MAKMPWFNPTPGEQRPDKYNGIVGPNYKKWGEIPGFLYSPGTDEYYLDKRSPAQKKIEEEAERQALKGPPSLLETVAPVGALGAAYFGGKALGEKLPETFGGLFDFGADKAAPALGEAVTTGTAATQGAGATGLMEVGSAANGGTLLSDGSVAGAPGIGLAPYLGAGAAGLGAYQLYKGLKAGDTKSSALGGAGLAGGLAAAAPLAGFGPLGWGAIGLSALGGGALGAGLSGLFDHESTRDIAKKHTSQLSKMGGNDSNWQNYVGTVRAQFNEGPPDPDNPYFGGKYGSWDEYKSAGLNADDLSHVYGNLKTYGPAWASLSQDQRRAITQANIDSGLYRPNKGEVEITDAAKAKANFDAVMNPKPAAPAAKQQPGAVMLDTTKRPAFDPTKLDPKKIDPGFNVKPRGMF